MSVVVSESIVLDMKMSSSMISFFFGFDLNSFMLSGVEWHPRIPHEQNHLIHDDLPHFIMDPYEECRDPPRLHMLDK